MSDYPEIFHVRQSFPRPRVEDVAAEVQRELATLHLGETIRAGQTVAVTAGSRGIAQIHRIIKAIVDHLKELGASPFIVPAMGSHAGGMAEGQRALIERYGITEQYCGCPIHASMETAIVCRAQEGFPVHFDRHAYQADHVVVCGRVKPHTNFTGDVESGLMKMMLIGLGKHEGAKIYHRAIQDYSFAQIVRSVAREVLAKCKIAAGVAIVENGYDETAKIAAVRPDEFEQREKQLLLLAREWMPRLPFDRAGILLLDEIGKNISGTGMDTNVVGRKYGVHQAAPDEFPKIRMIAIRNLTDETHGNATGLGMAEFCRARAPGRNPGHHREGFLPGHGAHLGVTADGDERSPVPADPGLGVIADEQPVGRDTDRGARRGARDDAEDGGDVGELMGPDDQVAIGGGHGDVGVSEDPAVVRTFPHCLNHVHAKPLGRGDCLLLLFSHVVFRTDEDPNRDRSPARRANSFCRRSRLRTSDSATRLPMT